MDEYPPDDVSKDQSNTGASWPDVLLSCVQSLALFGFLAYLAYLLLGR